MTFVQIVIFIFTRESSYVLSPTYFPMSQDGIDSVVGKRGLFMCRIASFFLLQRLKESMSGDASCHQVFFSARQGPEGSSRHSDRNVRGTCTIVCHRMLSALNKSRVWSLQLVSFLVGLRTYQHPLVLSFQSY